MPDDLQHGNGGVAGNGSNGMPAEPELDPADAALFALSEDQPELAWAERAARAAAATPAVGPIGGFELLEEVGRGGQGAVYKARQPGTGRIVALKRIGGLTLSAHDRRRFALEIEALARLGHPTVVTVYSAESIGDQSVLVMEYVDGVPIDAWSDGTPIHPKPSTRQLLTAFAAVCDGVAHAHKRGVIHRDIKPGNVLVEADGRPRLLDFGIAKLIGEWRLSEGTGAGQELTTTSFAGTPAFAAPEQLEGPSRADTLSDVYSLGALLYRMLTGRAPFVAGGGLPEMIDLVRRGGPTRPSRVRAGVSAELDWIVLKAMEVEPGRRYQGAEALAADVRRFLRGEAVGAHPPTTAYRLRKWIRQNRVLAVSAVLVSLTLLGSTGVSTRYSIEARRALAEANAALARETAAHQEAAAAAEESRAAAGFLTDVLGSADTGRLDVTIREALDTASAELADGRRKYPPRVEAGVRFAIGQTYAHIGLLEDAEKHLARALEIRRSLFDLSSEQVMGPLHILGRTYRGLGRLADAERIQRDVVAARRARLAAPAPEKYDRSRLAQALVSLGIALRMRGKYDEAIAAYYEAHDLYTEELGEINDDSGTTLRNISVILIYQRKFAEAEVVGRRALTLLRQYHGNAPHLNTAIATCSLGQALWERGDQAEGEKLLREGLEMHRSLHGETHFHSAEAAQLLAGYLMEQERWTEAEPLMRSALAARSALRPADSAPVRKAEADLARVLCGLGRCDEAIKLCTDSIARGGDPAALRNLYMALGSAHRAQKQFARGHAALTQAWELVEANANSLAPGDVRRAARELVELYESWDEAEPGKGYAAEAARWRDRTHERP